MRTLLLALTLALHTACSLMAHPDVGYTVRPAAGPDGGAEHGAVLTLDAGRGLNAETFTPQEQVWQAGLGVGAGTRARIYGSPWGSWEVGPMVYAAASREGRPLTLFASAHPYVGVSFHPDQARFVFSPTLKLGQSWCLARLSSCVFVTGFGGYDLIPQRSAWPLLAGRGLG